MLRKTLILCLSAIALAFSSYAQKDTKDPFTVMITISPTQLAPAQPTRYRSEIETPLNPLTSQETRDGVDKNKKLATMARTKLAVSGSNLSLDLQNPDWIIKLATSDVTITSTNPKPVGELSNSDYLFKFSYNAMVVVTDKSGNVVYKTDVGQSGKEQEMPKGVFFLNPVYKMKLAMVKNNPEKTQKIVDEMMENKNALILENIVDQAATALDNAYETQTKTINMSLFSVKGKAYEELSATSDKIKETYGKFRALSKKNRIPKEEVDKVMRDAIAVWEKYVANNREIEEKAAKGLTLNCALASAWLGEYDKASEYLSKVPEAKMPDTNLDEDNSTPPGTTPMLSFNQSAENVFYFNQLLKDGGIRATIVQ